MKVLYFIFWEKWKNVELKDIIEGENLKLVKVWKWIRRKECERYDGGKWEILNDLNIYGYKLYIVKYEGKK